MLWQAFGKRHCSDGNVFFHCHLSHLFKIKANCRKMEPVEQSGWSRSLYSSCQLKGKNNKSKQQRCLPTTRCRRTLRLLSGQKWAGITVCATGTHWQRGLGWDGWFYPASTPCWRSLQLWVHFGLWQISLLMGGLWTKKQSRLLFRQRRCPPATPPIQVRLQGSPFTFSFYVYTPPGIASFPP